MKTKRELTWSEIINPSRREGKLEKISPWLVGGLLVLGLMVMLVIAL